jgi:hypothetical protein
MSETNSYFGSKKEAAILETGLKYTMPGYMPSRKQSALSSLPPFHHPRHSFTLTIKLPSVPSTSTKITTNTHAAVLRLWPNSTY